MQKQDVINKAKSYSKDLHKQAAYIAGFKACCNMIRKDFEECYNDEFLSKMEELSEASFIDFDY